MAIIVIRVRLAENRMERLVENWIRNVLDVKHTDANISAAD